MFWLSLALGGDRRVTRILLRARRNRSCSRGRSWCSQSFCWPRESGPTRSQFFKGEGHEALEPIDVLCAAPEPMDLSPELRQLQWMRYRDRGQPDTPL